MTTKTDTQILVGTAGWTVPRGHADAFPDEGSSLERYAGRFGCAEINSSFHRSHRPDTWLRWAASVPDGFRFASKLSKEVTHKLKLVDCEAPLAASIAEMELLGDKLALVLVQLPPSLAFDGALAEGFFAALRRRWRGLVACEPRHASWLEGEADALLVRYQVARVAADPAKGGEGAAEPGGWPGLAYYRLHGSPIVYRSSYDDGRLEEYAERLARAAEGGPTWCIFDNTASSAALGDALKLKALLAA